VEEETEGESSDPGLPGKTFMQVVVAKRLDGLRCHLHYCFLFFT